MGFGAIKSLTIRLRRFSMDVLLTAIAFFVVTILPILQTFGVRPIYNADGPIKHLLIYTSISAAALAICGSYRMIWRYVSFKDLLTLIKATTLTCAIFPFAEILASRSSTAIPLEIMIWTLILVWIANIGFLAAPRLIARAIQEMRLAREAHVRRRDEASTVLLVGDPARMDSFIRECDRDRTSRHRVIGVLINEPKFRGSHLHGVPVLGSIEQLTEIIALLKDRGIRPEMIVLAKDDATGQDFEQLLEVTSQIDVGIGRLPAHGTFEGRTAIRPVELADLLGRPEVKINTAEIRDLIQGKRVLVTGAGGSIGSELSRQIATLDPAKLIVLDSSEFNLYSIDQELSEKFPNVIRETALVDVRDRALFTEWVRTSQPNIIFHAAALKHVPMLESHPIEAVKTNILGSTNVADACRAHGVAAMVTISTDKAVNPTNIMGATKRFAEAYCQGLDQAVDSASRTRFITVRFGNVLGSAGSVVPLFQRQIESGGPITVTHEKVSRYFMTIPEAVTLVLQAGAQEASLDANRGVIYVLDMGQPVRIIDLARKMVRLNGKRPDIDIEMKIVGLRPGEKLFEEVNHQDESISSTGHQSVLKIVPRVTDLKIMQQQIQEFRIACDNHDTDRVLRLLTLSVPEYLRDTMWQAEDVG